MTEKELAAMLGLEWDASPVDEAVPAIVETVEAGQSASVAKAKNAVVVTKYDCWQAEQALKDQPELAELKLNKEAIEDFQGILYQPQPKLEEYPEDAHRGEFVKLMTESQDYQELHVQTTLNQSLTDLAINVLADQYAVAVAEQKQRCEQRQKERSNRKLTGQEKEADAFQDEQALVGAAYRASQEAVREVQQFQDNAQGFGIGGGPGAAMNPQQAARAVELHKQLKRSQKLKQIALMAGKMLNVARAKQRLKTDHGQDTLVDYELSGDLRRAVPHEVALLVHPTAWPLGVLRLVGKSMLSKKFIANTPAGKGPILLACDSSGSMSAQMPGMGGFTREEAAKAFALGLAWIAQKQRRWCGLMLWSDKGQRRTLVLPPGQRDEMKLVEWLQTFLGGGTEPPLDEMPELFAQCQAPAGRTDIILLTDDVLRIADDTAQRFNAWKGKVKARMISIALGAAGGNVQKVSDEVYSVPVLDPAGEPVGRAFSV